MTSKTFVSGTVIDSAWLNDVDAATYDGAAVYMPAGTGSAATTVQTKLRESVSVKDFGAVGDGVTDDTAAIQAAIDSMTAQDSLLFPDAVAYKITSRLSFVNKTFCTFDFNNQLINASGFITPDVALYFNGIAHSRINNIFLIGNTTNVTHGVLFDSDATHLTTFCEIEKVYVNNCSVGVQFGPDTNAINVQFSDSYVDKVFASECDVGVLFSGANTLAMAYGTVGAYLCNAIGIHFRSGNGSIGYLVVASNPVDVFFGYPDGSTGVWLQRWDINGGYSEQGANGEIFISSAACTDTSPFISQVTFRGFRCTPFSSTTVQKFIQWRLNGDLIFEKCTFTIETQMPRALLEANSSYRAPRVEFNQCVLDGSTNGGPQVLNLVETSNVRDSYFINSQVNNCISFWNNSGSINEGVISRGVYMGKLDAFENSLFNISGLISAWRLDDLFSTTQRAKNSLLGFGDLVSSAPLETRDYWFDDGLIGIYRNTTTEKTVSIGTSLYAAASEYTFGAIIRQPTAGRDDTDSTSLGGALGMRLGAGQSGGEFVSCRIGGVNATATPSNGTGLDAHLVIGRYISGTSLKVDAINLRTGELLSNTNVTSIPVFGALTWVNGVSLINTGCVKGFPFVYNRALTDAEISELLRAATRLTSSWRLA